MPRENFKAVYDDQLLQLLEELDIKEDFDSGNLECHFCGDVLTWDNLHSLFPLSGAVKAVCQKSGCVKELITHYEGRTAED